MIDCISVDNMRKSDAWTIANLVPSLDLMYRAAYGVYLAGTWQGSVAIVTGSGNNGGDGFALAWIFQQKGIASTVFTVSQTLSADSAYYAQKAQESGVSIQPFHNGCLDGYQTVVDCLLGTGFQGSLREPYRQAIQEINRHGVYTVSVDINSGMNGDTGEYDLAVSSDLTVTIGFVKTGLVKSNAGSLVKRLVCVDIGIVLEKEEYKLCDQTEILPENGILSPPWLDMHIIKAY